MGNKFIDAAVLDACIRGVEADSYFWADMETLCSRNEFLVGFTKEEVWRSLSRLKKQGYIKAEVVMGGMWVYKT